MSNPLFHRLVSCSPQAAQSFIAKILVQTLPLCILAGCASVAVGPQPLHKDAQSFVPVVSDSKLPSGVNFTGQYPISGSDFASQSTNPNGLFLGLAFGAIGGAVTKNINEAASEERARPLVQAAKKLDLRSVVAQKLSGTKSNAQHNKKVEIIPVGIYMFESPSSFNINCTLFARLLEDGKEVSRATYALSQKEIIQIDSPSIFQDIQRETQGCLSDAVKILQAHMANQLGAMSTYEIKIPDPILGSLNVNYRFYDDWLNRRLLYHWTREDTGQHIVEMPRRKALSLGDAKKTP